VTAPHRLRRVRCRRGGELVDGFGLIRGLFVRRILVGAGDREEQRWECERARARGSELQHGIVSFGIDSVASIDFNEIDFSNLCASARSPFAATILTVDSGRSADVAVEDCRSRSDAAVPISLALASSP